MYIKQIARLHLLFLSGSNESAFLHKTKLSHQPKKNIRYLQVYVNCSPWFSSNNQQVYLNGSACFIKWFKWVSLVDQMV
ncbi:hypothetical protein HanRHA438_Chr17g0819271 [Helianthus annuus]|nr:hypothetical protein HanRHA438_Chr17g0819271 [Helianthus annuus]